MDAIISTLGLEYGRKRDDRSGDRTPTALFGYKRIGSPIVDRLHSGIRGFQTRKSETSHKCQRRSRIKNIQSHQGHWPTSRNRINCRPCQDHTKFTQRINFYLDEFILCVRIAFHNNNPTPNKKARLQPGFAGKLNLNLMFCLPPRLFAVNQKTGE
ncbi:hypothetical protein LEP1GSC163_0198 [Leptospira santarosai str. CBC379]|nr:hypothetical protein LEP1GSC163_0198 [Leptospira santarosai str. CBC379]